MLSVPSASFHIFPKKSTPKKHIIKNAKINRKINPKKY